MRPARSSLATLRNQRLDVSAVGHLDGVVLQEGLELLNGGSRIRNASGLAWNKIGDRLAAIGDGEALAGFNLAQQLRQPGFGVVRADLGFHDDLPRVTT